MAAVRDLVSAVLRRLPYFRGKGTLGELLSRILPRGHAVQTRMRDGTTMTLDLNSGPQRLAYWAGEYDRQLIQVLRASLPAGGVAIDVGANIGLYTIPLARHAALVLAVEALPANVERLRLNIAANGLTDRVVVAGCALAATAGTWRLRGEQKPGLTGNAVRADPGEEGVESRVTTLDELAGTLNIARCDVVKVDIEGAELDFLRGGERFLRSCMPLICLELNSWHMGHFGWTFDDLKALADEWGYAVENMGGSGGIETAFLVGHPRSQNGVVGRPRPVGRPPTDD